MLYICNVNKLYADRLIIMTSSLIIKMLEDDGWILDRTKGSHHVFKHPRKKGIVVVPHPKKDIPNGTYNSILKQAGLK